MTTPSSSGGARRARRRPNGTGPATSGVRTAPGGTAVRGNNSSNNSSNSNNNSNSNNSNKNRVNNSNSRVTSNRSDAAPTRATWRRGAAPDADATFESLGVPAVLIETLARGGVTAPFPIQAATMADALAGNDVLGRGRTGSGKTLAFAIPTIVALSTGEKRRTPGRPRGLVLVPTRELATQVAEAMTPLAKAVGLRVATIFGGVGIGGQAAALRQGVDVVVACPGRLEDVIAQGFCKLDQVEVTVLDEADHMADLGFLPAVRRLLDATPRDGQRLLFSATLDQGVEVLVTRYLHDPVEHSVDPEVAPVSTMTHHVFAVSAADKVMVVRELAAGSNRSLLFTRTKHGAKKLAKHLTASGIPAVELHGNLSQNARVRNLQDFADGTSRVLVATDIAARGIHVDDLPLVIHVDPPSEHKAYLHRSGRTARAGAAGTVVTMMTPDQVAETRALTKAAGINPIVTRVSAGHEAITELVGAPAPLVMPAPVVARTTPTRAPGAPGGSRGASSSRPHSGAPRSAGAGARSGARGGGSGGRRGR